MRRGRWCEVSLLYTFAELPGVYVEKDGRVLEVLDHIEAERVGASKLRLTNPTAYEADVRLLVESVVERVRPLPMNPGTQYRRERLAAGESRIIDL